MEAFYGSKYAIDRRLGASAGLPVYVAPFAAPRMKRYKRSRYPNVPLCFTSPAASRSPAIAAR